MEIFCFFTGILYLYTLNHSLPVFTLLCFHIHSRYSFFLFFILGLLLAGLHQFFINPKGIPELSVIPKAVVRGTISSIPNRDFTKTQFLFSLEQIDNQPAQGLIQLSWYQNAIRLHTGQKWQFTVKLKKPRNYLNSGSSDYVGMLSARHIQWTGYILSKQTPLKLEAYPIWSWLSIREYLSNKINRLAPDRATAGIVEALTLNVTNHISQQNWDLFRRTGTTHLFGISGEHIALISGIIFWFARRIWSLNARCCLYVPAPYIASICGLIAALFYSFLAGFAPPVQRALIGCFFYTLYRLGKRRFSAWQIWRYAMMGVLCIEPHAVFMQGFYFSFFAVACLLLTQQRWKLQGYKGNLALQLSCLIGLMPLTLYWYSYGSINGFLANLFAIPLVGFLIVPLALITMVFSSWGIARLLMKLLSWLIAILFKGLWLIERLAIINLNCYLPDIGIALLLMGGILIWISLPVKPFKVIALLWMIIPFFLSRPTPHFGEAIVDILDVGQGLSVAIRSRHHTIIYDTGDQFFKGNDLGKMVVVPYLKYLGISKIDTIIISHPDKDHRGGLKSIEKEMQVDQLIVNEPKEYPHGLNCHLYPKWHWDGIEFRFFPIKTHFNNKNNNSCILRVSTMAGSILLPGDIERKAEDYLIKNYGTQLASSFLILPHHGSKTSSSYRFLLEVAPHYAIASLGFDNRFHFPHAKTVTSMKSLNIPMYRTDECGMVQVVLPAQGEIKEPVCFNGLNVSA